MGLRDLREAPTTPIEANDSKQAASPSIKVFREKDGNFRFKVLDEEGRVLIESFAFENPKLSSAVLADLIAVRNAFVHSEVGKVVFEVEPKKGFYGRVPSANLGSVRVSVLEESSPFNKVMDTRTALARFDEISEEFLLGVMPTGVTAENIAAALEKLGAEDEA
jgi:hypothetical protein